MAGRGGLDRPAGRNQGSDARDRRRAARLVQNLPRVPREAAEPRRPLRAGRLQAPRDRRAGVGDRAPAFLASPPDDVARRRRPPRHPAGEDSSVDSTRVIDKG